MRPSRADLPERVAGCLSRYSTRVEGQKVGVAVSGGSDSIALLEILAELAPRFAMRLCVLHFQHGLRPGESEGDERFVAEAARRLELPFYCERWGQAPQANVEASARRARIEFFLRMRAELGLSVVATGHTLDDQAETVLMRILRGTGTSGLAGVLRVTREGLIRPLLDITREELRDWLRAKGTSWREDQTNSDPEFADRNRLRLELMPLLRSQWNPEIFPALARLADIAQEEEAWLIEEAEAHLPPSLIFDCAALSSQPRGLQRRVIRLTIERALGDLRRIDFSDVESVVEMLEPIGAAAKVDLPRGISAERSFGLFRIGSEPRLDPEEVSWRKAAPPGGESGAYNKGEFYVDAAKIGAPLELRSWKFGDRFWLPVGSQPENVPVKLKELFQRARVPTWERRCWPVLTSAGQIVWMRGAGVAAGYQAGTETREAILITDRKSVSWRNSVLKTGIKKAACGV